MSIMYEAFKQVRTQMQPPQWASWQTFVLLSIFSAIVASMTSAFVQSIISCFGWVFLILGVWWFTYEPPVKKKLTFNKLFVGPWITGALISIWIFGSWEGRPNDAAFISWPVLSSLIWSMPRFVKTDPKTVTPDYTAPTPAARQDIVLMVLSNVIISCWFQLYFLTQDWLGAYPSLRSDDFSRSAFVVELQPQNRIASSRGVVVLDTAEQGLKARLEGKPWSEVERWLANLDQEMPALATDVKKQLPDFTENEWWDLKGQVTSDAYTLELQAIWQGPSARSGGYYIAKSCQITQNRRVNPVTSAPETRSTGTVKCDEPSQPQPSARQPQV